MISIVKDLAAEALFVSSLQPSERPNRRAVEQAVTAMILLHGSDGCAAEVATEFGDHPEMAVRRMNLSARAHDRMLRVARTIADLDHSQNVSAKHLAEAVQCRNLDRNYWN